MTDMEAEMENKKYWKVTVC